MVKIIHISDLHWRGIQRHDEYTNAFERLFKQLEEQQVDLIVNTGDTFHTKTQGITPEVIERLSWMFNNLANIAPTYTMLGNHDLSITNLNRLDIISPIHESINHPRAHMLKKSGVYQVKEITQPEIYLSAFSLADKKNWKKVKPVAGKSKNVINIAMYHGSISNSKMDNNWSMPADLAEADIKDFNDYDFVFLGDIHKQQFLQYEDIETEVDETELQDLYEKYDKQHIEIIEEK